MPDREQRNHRIYYKQTVLKRAQMALEDLGPEFGIEYPRLVASLPRMSAATLEDLANMIRALRSQ